MMQLRYDEDFIEAAVFLAASGRRQGVPSLQIARFHREREKLYSLLDPDERNAAFFRLHLDWFREWGLEKLLTDVLQEFPLLPEKLTVLALRKTHGKNDEGAELYVNEAGQRTGLLALRLERFVQDAALTGDLPGGAQTSKSAVSRVSKPAGATTGDTAPTWKPAIQQVWKPAPRHDVSLSPNASLTDFLRHEFTHLHDMLDPAFGYSPALGLPGLNTAQQRLARERYRLLWDISIDGRLASAGHMPMATREQHAAAFSRGYSFWPAEKQSEVFESLWRNAAPRHSDFLALIADPRGLRDAHRPAPGASCPLCAFPTFDWADAGALPSGITSRIVAEFPAWSPEQGLCGRCLETYEAVASLQNEARLGDEAAPTSGEPERHPQP